MPNQIQNPPVPTVEPEETKPKPEISAVLPSQNPPPAPPVEPVPLPKVTDVEVVKPEAVTAPQTQMPPAPAAAAKAEEPHPLFEKPVIVTPEQKEEGKRQKEEGSGHKLPKGIIAGIAALVFLVVGLGSGLYLVKQRQDIRPFAASWADQNEATKQMFRSVWENDKAQEQWERERALFEATGGEQNKGLWGGAKDQQTVQEFWDSGVNNKQTPKEERQEVVTAAQQAAEQAKQQGASAAEAAAVAKAAVKEVGAPGVSPPGGTGVIGGDAGACYGLGDRDLEAKCIANAKGGQYQAGDCRTEDCLSSGYVVYCRGPQETADSPRAGEFLTCGPQFTSTGGCGQADVYASKQAYDSGLMPTGFIIDKSNCAAAPPQVTTEEAPPREFPPEPTLPPGATATPTPVTISANCQSLAGQVSDGAGGWITKTDSEFAAQARPGDRVRFVCTGAKSRGNFTKSAFFINDILHVDDVIKLNDTQFAVEYTIPAAGTLTVKSVLLHDSKGWVD